LKFYKHVDRTKCSFRPRQFSARVRRGGQAIDREASSCNAAQLPRFLVHTYFRLFTLSQKKTNCLPYRPHLKHVAALPCKMHNFFIFFILSRVSSTNIRDTDELPKRFVATWLNFNRAWWTMQLISGEKDWEHVSVQKVATLNICCNVACLTFHLPRRPSQFGSTSVRFKLLLPGLRHGRV